MVGADDRRDVVTGRHLVETLADVDVEEEV